ncbi:MAG: alpha/beta hydrolase [Eubacterium sp.]|nr:alpha/beta hydrolase [Eubacterium sp.]
MSFITDSAECEGFETEYVKFGSGDKALVILPGLSVQSLIPLAPAIEKQYGLFKNEFTVYLFERRKDLPGSYSVYDMGNDTAGAMKTLGIKDACIFGASQGGMIAMCLALDYPELVSRLALGSTAARVSESRSGVIKEWISLAEKADCEGLYLSFGKRVYPENVFESFKDTFKEMAKTVSDEDLKRFIILARGTLGFDVTDKLENINCPLLLTGDDSDGVLGEEAFKELEALLSDKEDFEAYLYSSFGHAVYDTAPDYTERLYNFFTK